MKDRNRPLNGILTLAPVMHALMVIFSKKVDFNLSRFMYKITTTLYYLEVRNKEWNPKEGFLSIFFNFTGSREF